MRAELVRLLPELTESGVSAPSDPPDTPRLFEAMCRLLACLTRRTPVVFILEDLHWADEMSLHLFQFLARRATRWPLFLVGTLRDEELPDLPLLRQTLEGLEGEAHVARLRVAPLSRPATLQLVRALSSATGKRAAPAALGQDVWRASEGNPFVVVETVRALQHGVGASRAPGGATLVVGPGGLPLAERVRQVTARRLDRLGEGARELAAVAAVIGRGFEFSLLQHAARRDEASTATGVEEIFYRRVETLRAPASIALLVAPERPIPVADLLPDPGPQEECLHDRGRHTRA